MSQYIKNSRIFFGILLVSMSLFLIVVVGYAQTLKSYKAQTREAILAQAEVAKLNIEQILNSGVPLQEIAGLQTLLAPIADTDPSVVDIRLTSGELELYRYTNVVIEGNLVSIPLSNKFSVAGSLEILLSDAPIKGLVDSSFSVMLWVALILIALFVWSIAIQQSGARYLKSFSVVFLTMTLLVVALVSVLLKQSLENKAVAMSDIISHRIAPIMQEEIDPSLVVGLDEMLADFISTNNEVASLTLNVGGERVAYSADEAHSQWLSQLATYESTNSLGNSTSISFHPEVLLEQLLRVLKSFAILFGGCAFVCFAFVKLLSREEKQPKRENVLDKIKALLLMTVLMESLMAPMLPEYIEVVVLNAGYSGLTASLLFSFYFLGFTVTLLPAARLADFMDSRQILIGGIVLSAMGSLALIIGDQLSMILVARFVSGVGQAAIFIAVQHYILSHSNQENKTQAAGIIVFCFNAGFIAGAAFGALLVDMIGVKGIFMLSALIGVSMFVFAQWLPTQLGTKTLPNASSKYRLLKYGVKTMGQDAKRYIAQSAFLRALLLVGAPAKMLMTGVVFFAIPLVLAERNIASESIGQVLMTYAIAVLFVSGKVAPIIDKRGDAKLALCLGNVFSAISLVVLGIGLQSSSDMLVVSFSSVSMLILGLAHGLINAPVVTHVINHVPSSDESTAASTYRFLERFGHISGAILVGVFIRYFGIEMGFFLLAAAFSIFGLLMYLLDGEKLAEAKS
ncbi:MFS transporter [Enterovibrio sp. ZSDZ35]|uniref:MFS transporter n=1 Tax=Enterovibrio qingdaonensis TaxID=2899818 RepID=A0ABT5QSL2_9GAMM|nr:MFS transporter [Enterovibrio sp. ZSDZ35]MDD1783973.1 MFS transporter [Enterovibrio sp. ZSDZ35]